MARRRAVCQLFGFFLSGGWMDEMPNPRWGEWKMAWLGEMAVQGCRNRVPDRPTNGDESAFSGAFGTQRIVRAWPQAERGRSRRGKICRRWEEVVGECSR